MFSWVVKQSFYWVFTNKNIALQEQIKNLCLLMFTGFVMLRLILIGVVEMLEKSYLVTIDCIKNVKIVLP